MWVNWVHAFVISSCMVLLIKQQKRFVIVLFCCFFVGAGATLWHFKESIFKHVEQSIHIISIENIKNSLTKEINTLKQHPNAPKIVQQNLPQLNTSIDHFLLELAQNLSLHHVTPILYHMLHLCGLVFIFTLLLLRFYFQIKQQIFSMPGNFSTDLHALITDIRACLYGVVLATLLNAFIQTLIAMCVFIAVKLPYLILWSLACFAGALTPFVGANAIVFLSALPLLKQGHYVSIIPIILTGIFLTFAGFWLQVWLQKRHIQIHPLLLLLLMASGAYHFGPLFILYAPLSAVIGQWGIRFGIKTWCLSNEQNKTTLPGTKTP